MTTKNPIRKNRWYDSNEALARRIESLKGMRAAVRDRVVQHILEIINGHEPNLLEKYLLEFPLDQQRRRWYDKEPYLWLAINGLQRSTPKLLKRVTDYLGRTAR